MVTILSIDGGGIRGIIPATILAEFEKKTGKPICQLFDYIAGTSTGGIITAMLTTPDKQGRPKYTAEEVKSDYIRFGRTVFQRSAFRKIATLDGLTIPRYSVKALERFLNQYLGNVRLHSTLTNILIPAYDMKSCTPWFFKTAYASVHRSDVDDPLLSQVARATSAAPTFFRPLRMGASHCFIDGGVFANNPAICAYAEARKSFPQESEFFIVSLGTGEHQKRYSCEQTKNWGTLRWTMPLFGVIMNSASSTVDYQMKTLVGTENYVRFQVRLDCKSTDMDNASGENIKRLEALSRMEIKQNSQEIEQVCRILKSSNRHITTRG